MTPERVTDGGFIDWLEDLSPDLIVVAAYGRILPRRILEIPAWGCLNLHASLLPRWRGAAPIQRAIIAGDRILGVSIMRMEAGMDTGPIMKMASFPTGDLTGGEAEEIMAGMGAKMMLEVVNDILAHTPIPQPMEGVTVAHKIMKDDARLDFSRDANEVERMVRAYNPCPGAWTMHVEERLAVHACIVVDGHGRPGEIIGSDFTIACGRGAVRLTKVQRPGRRAVKVSDMLHSIADPIGERCT